MSPFSRRTRLALAHKQLDVVLCDARGTPSFREEAQRLFPVKTVPVLVEADGRTLADSTAISHYLDLAYPTAPKLWAGNPVAALKVCVLVDAALNPLVDVGTRYFGLNTAPGWEGVRDEYLGRAQLAFDALPDAAAELGADWCAPHMWLFTAVRWLEVLPARAKENPMVAQLMSLRWTLPPSLSKWADAYRGRADALALDA